ncbi:MAG: ATP-binding protein, partial [Gaiellaceae bacterium]
RQRTLRATIEWSYGLLSDRQRELHGALAVFAGGCTLADARAIAGSGVDLLPDLESLVAWSLLRSDVADGDVRLSMLETVREHAVARLDGEGTLEGLRQRHAERFLALASSAEDELTGSDQAAWLDRLERELDNIRAALDWLLASGRVEDALRAIAALQRFWVAHAHVGEARRWLSLGLALAGDVPVELRAAALWTAAQQATAQSDWDAAVPLLEEARELFHDSGNRRDEVFALSHLSFVALRRDDLEHAEELCEEALEIARRTGDARTTSAALQSIGDVHSAQSEHEQALTEYEEAVELRRGLGDPLLVADGVYNLGVTAFHARDHSRAQPAFEEALALARMLGEAPHIAAAQFMLAELGFLAGDTLTRERARESLSIYTELGDDRSRARCLVLLGGVAAAEGSPEDAARFLGAAESLRGESPPDLFELTVLERVLPELSASLGDTGLAALRAEGARLRDRTLAQVVPVGIEE